MTKSLNGVPRNQLCPQRADLPLIVSVESRKGGVGKTTAALCLGRMLLKRGYAVLVVDVDLTGTNAADVADSPYWQEDLHAVTEVTPEAKDSSDSTPPRVNLLAVFEQLFLVGKEIPKFGLCGCSEKRAAYFTVDLGRVNIMGSQVYKTGKKVKTTKSLRIEDPGTLFDPIHAYWLLEFVRDRVEDFADRVREVKRDRPVAIILDNSPGYVGLGPDIQDWLTDRGPHKSKFLTVMSLDAPDINACGASVAELHRLYTIKWETSRLFIEAGVEGESTGADLGLDETDDDQDRFFMQLVSMGGESEANGQCRTSSDDPPWQWKEDLAFYRTPDRAIGKQYMDSANKYQAVLVNRVPEEITTGNHEYQMPPDNGEDSLELLTKLLGGERTSRHWMSRMIQYDPYLEHQFLWSLRYGHHEGSSPGPREVTGFLDGIEQNLDHLGRVGKGEVWFGASEDIDPGDLARKLTQFDRLVYQAMERVKRSEWSHLVQPLVHASRWLPGSIVPSFRSCLISILLPYGIIHDWPIEEIHGSDDMAHVSPHAQGLVRHIPDQIAARLEETHADTVRRGTVFRMFALSLGRLAGLAIGYQPWPSDAHEIVVDLLAEVVSTEVSRWTLQHQRGRQARPNLSFLAQERLTPAECEKYFALWLDRFSRRGIVRRPDELATFYGACASGQARLMSFGSDCIFLIRLLRNMIERAEGHEPRFPRVDDIVEDAIVHKKISHAQAYKLADDRAATAQYFRRFDEVLESIVADWGLAT